jgi:uncharacterized protein YprB with RNaseH-like and TPR domain
MARFRDKLARLDEQLARRQRHARAQTDGDTEPHHPAQRLAALERALGAVVGERSSEQSPASAADADARHAGIASLGFRRVDDESGSGWRRSLSHGDHERVGAVALGAVRAADARMTSLLALDPALASREPNDAVYLDTETTGLGGSGSVAFLIGLAWYDAASGHFVLEQHLLAEPADEPCVLERVRRRLARASLWVSYNGKSFDVPMLESRYVMNGLSVPERAPHLDLLHVVRRIHKHRPWRKSLKGAERHVLAFDRGADVSGEEVAQRYRHYLRSGEVDGLAPVVRHNELDVRSLLALAAVYGEPLSDDEHLGAGELAQAARVMRRAGALDSASHMAQEAIARGGGASALRVRGEIAKARGDKRRALEDFEQAAAALDDAGLRLELAKLYEHFAKQPARALDQAERGTGEAAEDQARRVARLKRKIARRRNEP